MKLTKAKLLDTIRRKNDGWTTYQARKIARISIRRVNQVYGDYIQTGQIPEIGKKVGRPSKPITDEEIRIVNEAYEKYRVCASTLRRIIDRDYGIRINHNRIHKIMVSLGLAKPLDETHKRKKDWIRYERRHSLTAVHIDWYYDSAKEKWVFAVEDDASSKMLALLEVDNATTDWSIEGMRLALKHGKIQQCICDHGAQFIHNLGGESRFQAFLEEQGISRFFVRLSILKAMEKSRNGFKSIRTICILLVAKKSF